MAVCGARAGGVRAAAASGKGVRGARRGAAAAGRRAAPVVLRAKTVEAEPAVEAAEGEESDPSTIGKALPAVLGIDEIMDILPHRAPFLLVDRVVEYVPGKYAVGLKNVTYNDNFFPGHFPERPLMPGVLQVEAMAQVGGLVMLTEELGGSKDSFFFGGVDNCKFRRPVVPGDQLVMKVELVKLNKRFGVAKMAGKAYVGDELACEADLTMFMGSK